MSTLDAPTPLSSHRQNTASGTVLLRNILLLLPLLVATYMVARNCSDSIRTRMGMRFPLDPWESMYIVDAARAAEGMPVYEPLETGHATHMYGPLGTYLIATVFEFTGPSVRVGRYLSLGSGLAATLLYTLIFIPRRNVLYLIIGAALFGSLHIRCMGLFTNTRPDITAYLLATLALVVAYQAQVRNKGGWYVVSAALIVMAFLIKQTYAVTAMVPPLALLLLRPDGWRRHLLPSLIPCAAMGVTALVLKFGFPLVWFYMIDVPKQYRIFQERVYLGLMSLLMNNPLFVAVFVMAIFSVGIDARKEPRLGWLLISMVIGGAMGIVAFAKQGGNYNSLLMIFGPMTAFCMMLLPRVMQMLSGAQVPFLARFTVSLVLALAMLTTTFGVPMSMRLAFTHAGNTSDYFRAIEIARNLEGTVLCPEEPSIPLFARKEYQKNLSAEIEALGNGRVATVRNWLDRNAANADWIITVSTPDMPGRLAAFMPDLGFAQVPREELRSGYTLWRKAGPTTQGN